MNQPHLPALEICAQAEDRIRQAQQLLLEPRPETIDRAVAELMEVIGALKQVRPPITSDLRDPLQRIRTVTRALARQVEHASNLYMGLVQLRMANGYTRQGLPLVHSSARNSVEA